MNSSKCNLTLLLSIFLLVSGILITDAQVRNKIAPPIIPANPEFGGLAVANEIVQNKLLGNPVYDGGKPKKKEHIKIAETPQCAADVQMFCSDKISSNNLLVLDCLQDNEKTASRLSDSCHHFLWTYKLKLTRDSKFEDASSEACAPELQRITECQNLDQGEVIPCLIEHYEEVKSKPCSVFLSKMASIIFNDYRLMNFFIKDCKNDISMLKCGRLEPFENEDDSPHSQGKTVACLSEHKKELSKPCKKSLLRVAELQSEDFHLDRPLYYACRGDRENLCHDVVAGDGEVFNCLFKHLGDARLSDNCRARLEDRQQLIGEDVKVDKSFYDACKEDIEKNQCTMRGHRDDDGTEDLSRSSILLCLEEAHSRKENIKLECLREMFELRSELMEDYKLSAELARACDNEIKNFCPLQREDNVLHCLMKKISLNRNTDAEDEFSSECEAEVTRLVDVANPGEDIRLDGPLMRACGDMVSQACSEYHAGQGDIITCLLENLDHEDMTDECEAELLVIQYFAARDFRLDYHLFKQCHNDALKLCHSSDFSDPSTMKPDDGPLVFACLHRHLRSDNPEDIKPSRPCIHEIKRVMRERSYKVNLMPEVEAACMEDLSQHCSDDDEHKKYDGEMDCLQSILEDLTEKCRIVVSNFTLEAAEDIEVDRTLMRYCAPMIKWFCSDLLNQDAMPSEVFNCLIEHKNNNHMEGKCAASIEHHQIISLTDFRFTRTFYDACHESASRYCKNKQRKYDVVACLSELVRNDTIRNDGNKRIEEKCRQQLKFELLQRGETIDLDPDLKHSCEADIRDFCQHERSGEGEVVECLRTHRERLSDSCHRILFQREKDDAMFGDYTLRHVCKKMIKKHCVSGAEEADILKCLIENKDQDDDFDDRCRQVVHERQVEQTRDIELNPNLHKACRLEVQQYCADVFKAGSPKDKGMEGKVIDCLKKVYASNTKVMSKECDHEVQFLIKEAALDINLNPGLMRTCKDDIERLCLHDFVSTKGKDAESFKVFGSGAIMECLKKNFKILKDLKCKEGVAYSVAESGVDVHVDPLLHVACQQDLVTKCKLVIQGQGRQILCLLYHLQHDSRVLTKNCRDTLQRRKALWKSAVQVAPADSFSELLDGISSSPVRNYIFAVLFTVVGIVFIVGLLCGRVMKRVRAEIKNK